MLGLSCLRPTASPVGKPRPAGLVLGPGSTPCGSQGACSPGSTRTARHQHAPTELPQDRPLAANRRMLSCDNRQGSAASVAEGSKPAEVRCGSRRSCYELPRQLSVGECCVLSDAVRPDREQFDRAIPVGARPQAMLPSRVCPRVVHRPLGRQSRDVDAVAVCTRDSLLSTAARV
jgi:hypothetical protein